MYQNEKDLADNRDCGLGTLTGHVSCCLREAGISTLLPGREKVWEDTPVSLLSSLVHQEEEWHLTGGFERRY